VRLVGYPTGSGYRVSAEDYVAFKAEYRAACEAALVDVPRP
jgi:hypothetical protein